MVHRSPRLIALRRIALVVASLLIFWRIAAVGMSQHFANRIPLGDETAAAKALSWHGAQPEARLRQAQQLLDQDPVGAAEQARSAYLANPANPQPLLVLARSAEPGAEAPQAYVKVATQLAPVNPNIATKAAAFWLGRGDLPRALEHWSRALEADPGMSRDLFPILLQIAEDPQVRMVFADYARDPPRWWPGFFDEAARRALDVETVRFLYALRRDARAVPIGETERAAYIARLQREGQATEAYLVWVNGLDDARRQHLGLLFNGGFEVPLSDLGFDWRRSKMPGVVIGTAKTFGTDGERSLHLLFQKTKGPFRHLTQDLYLQPGGYRLLGKVRPDSLKGAGGLQWALFCRPASLPVATSERFLGSGQWRDFSFAFELPQGCHAPQLLLQSVGERPSDHELSGAIWFDALRIRSAPSTAPAQGP
jgi:hypothetical protein